VLFTSRAPIGYVAIAANPVSTNQGFKSIVPYIAECSLFIATAMKSFAKAINDSAPGTTFKEVSGKMVAGISFPLPPIAEQQRIVAKVDELMALCDALESESAAAIAAHQELVEILLALLIASTSAADLALNWARLEAHFDSLFTTEASVDALKQAVLELSIRGKIVSQSSDDESAPALLKTIAREISAYSTENRIAKMPQDPIDRAILPFEVPMGWAWSRLSGLFKVVTDGDHQPPPKSEHGVAFLTIGNVTTGRLDFDGCRTVPESYYQSLAKHKTPAKGDILYTVVGATYGRPAVVDTDRRFCVQRHIAILKPSAHMDLRYLAFLLASPLVYNQASAGITGTAQPTIALGALRNFLVPVPPLAEQRRIVTQIDELMALCNALRVGLGGAAETQKNLADTIIESAAA
jgi:type I restriction enzyme, S subunit